VQNHCIIREKKRYLYWGLRPLNPHQGLCPWTPLGAYGGPQTPAYFFLVHVIPPHQKFLDPRLALPTPSVEEVEKLIGERQAKLSTVNRPSGQAKSRFNRALDSFIFSERIISAMRRASFSNVSSE
jgi:hypothetical protein